MKSERNRRANKVPACDNHIQSPITNYFNVEYRIKSKTLHTTNTNKTLKQLYLTSKLKLTKTPTTSDFSVFQNVMDVSLITDNLSNQDEHSEDAQPHPDLPPVSEEVECVPDQHSSEDTDDEEPPKKKPKRSSTIWSLLTVLMSLPPIRIDQYGEMYQKFRRCQNMGKMTTETLEHLFKILSVVGQMSKSLNGNNFIQNYSTHHLAVPLSTTYIDVAMKKKLCQWLNAFTTAGEVPKYQPSSEKQDLPLLASMLPSPGTNPSTTCTLSMTADGRTPPAGVVHSANTTSRHSSDDAPNTSTLYRPKTSGFFRSMSFLKENYKYSLRSPAIEGEYILKLEIYKSKNVMGQASMDWWKFAETRAFLPIPNNSKAMGLAIQLQQEIQRTLEAQPDAEGDYVQMKSFR